ncbi:MAG: amino acid permease [Desulfobacteraceae bacterium]|nr:amino acid permease [Desulfobacteraceae bacterium]MBC2719278.1 amino acid permease [Desulfobacteraceae bacterium]
MVLILVVAIFHRGFVGLIIVFVTAGLCLGHGSIENFSQGLEISLIFQDKFAISLIFITFAYSGWNAAAYLGGEIKNPVRNIPLALFTGTALVVCLYLLLNIVYIYALSPGEMSGVLEIGTKFCFCISFLIRNGDEITSTSRRTDLRSDKGGLKL